MSETTKRQAFSIQEEMGHSSPNQCPVNNELLKTGITQKSVAYKVAGSLITGKVCV
jgi:hypothetical protein